MEIRCVRYAKSLLNNLGKHHDIEVYSMKQNRPLLNSRFLFYVINALFYIFHLLGVCFLSPLTLLLQCLPKEPVEVECKSYQVSKAKRKKMEVSLAHPDNIASIQLIKLTTEKLSAISQTISTSVCKKMLMVVRSLLKNITSLNSQIEVIFVT